VSRCADGEGFQVRSHGAEDVPALRSSPQLGRSTFDVDGGGDWTRKILTKPVCLIVAAKEEDRPIVGEPRGFRWIEQCVKKE
jgi:hypothetical protein